MHTTATPLQHKAFSPARVGAIASNTLLELIRLKVFYFLLLFALVSIGGSALPIFFNMPFQDEFQILKDVSLGAMTIFTWLLSVLATAMMLPKDIEDRTLYTILAKPVPRIEYLLGKLLGVMLLLLISTLVMSAMFVITLYIRQQMVIATAMHEYAGAPEQLATIVRDIKAHTFTVYFIPGIVTIYIKAAIFAALTMMVSAFATSWIFTIFVTFMAYFIGSVEGIAREYWLSSHASLFARLFLLLVALLFPDLQLFSLVDDIVAGNAISMVMFWKTVGLGAGYIFVYSLVAYVIFAFKEL
jgi:ABC-type transport system involved in multi-copper enzyme maturation permease subunit